MLPTWEHFHRVKFDLPSNKSDIYLRIWADFFWNFGLESRRLFSPPALNLDINIDQRNRRRRHAGNARGLPDRLRDDLAQFLLHLARQPAHCLVIEPIRNAALLGLL